MRRHLGVEREKRTSIARLQARKGFFAAIGAHGGADKVFVFARSQGALGADPGASAATAVAVDTQPIEMVDCAARLGSHIEVNSAQGIP